MRILEILNELPDWQKYLAVAVLLVIFCVLYWYGVYKPAQADIARLDTRIAALDNQINKGLAMKDRLEAFRSEVVLLRERMRATLELLPDYEQMQDLLRTFESVAIQSGLRVTLFRPRPPRQSDFYAEKPIDLSMTGGYHELGIFFEKMAKEPRIVTFSTLTMTTLSGDYGQGSDRIRVDCEAIIYWFLEKEARHVANS